MRRITTLATVLAGLATSTATAVDLRVGSIQLTQGFQAGTTTLVGGRPTMARVTVTVTGSTGAVPGVDAVLRVWANGVELPGSPFRSVNGPVSAPVAPSLTILDNTLNFLIVPPVSGDVDFVAMVNPLGTVVETDYANNTLGLVNKVFACRKTLDLAYIPINYTPGGGFPPATYPLPGMGDAFVRGIYAVGELNYHRSPSATLNWTTDINSSNNTLLNTLSDIRLNQIPALGYARPEFIFGWLPGNPFSGNGQANGTPGDAAFGNSDQSRFQRTFAHELGHLWGRSHVTNAIGQPSVDVEHHLTAPLNLAQLHASTQYDVMVAGQLTNAAWVDSATYGDCLADTRSQCASFNGDGQGGGEMDAPEGERCLRVCGEFVHAPRSLVLQPATIIDLAPPTIASAFGDVLVTAFDADGNPLRTLPVRTDSARANCAFNGTVEAIGAKTAPGAGPSALLPSTPFYCLLPATIANREVSKVEIADRKNGRVLATQAASLAKPVVSELSLAPGADGGLEINWAASDRDGDSLVADVAYSPDGGSRWVPLAIGTANHSVSVGAGQVPASVRDAEGALAGIVRVRVSDGFNCVDREERLPAQGSSAGGLAGDWLGNNAPDIHILTPNNNQSVRQGGSVFLHASGWDLEDEYLPDSAFAWSSSLNGPLGDGRLKTIGTLSAGAHVITLTGTDSAGAFVAQTINITVATRAQIDADLDNDGVVAGGDLATLLANWGLAGLAQGDLDLNQVVDGGDLSLLLADWGS